MTTMAQEEKGRPNPTATHFCASPQTGIRSACTPRTAVERRWQWQVSWLAGPSASQPSQFPSGLSGALSAYSCGGSQGFGEASNRRAVPVPFLIPCGEPSLPPNCLSGDLKSSALCDALWRSARRIAACRFCHDCVKTGRYISQCGVRSPGKPTGAAFLQSPCSVTSRRVCARTEQNSIGGLR